MLGVPSRVRTSVHPTKRSPITRSKGIPRYNVYLAFRRSEDRDKIWPLYRFFTSFSPYRIVQFLRQITSTRSSYCNFIIYFVACQQGYFPDDNVLFFYFVACHQSNFLHLYSHKSSNFIHFRIRFL